MIRITVYGIIRITFIHGKVVKIEFRSLLLAEQMKKIRSTLHMSPTTSVQSVQEL